MIYAANGKVIEERQKLPRGNVFLKDGRKLQHKGEFPALPDSGIWQCDGLRIIASLDDTPHGKLLHVSMSYQDRDPTWEEIKHVRYAFFSPDVDVMMVMPKLVDYVNIHKHAFHIWQTPTEWGLL